FGKIDDVKWVDLKTVFIVYFRQQKKGRLFSFYESKGGKHRFEFPDEAQIVETSSFNEIDDLLLRTFTKRVAEFV
ncbi:MAG: hypothetical protein H7X80_10390, partial [bacterium]|nr:hypothetical protein [Candidatus Kapabacteria bacterium]